jgi:hypothetical protein
MNTTYYIPTNYLLLVGKRDNPIVNDIYNRQANFTGIIQSYNLISSNLNVIGDYTIFNTTIYQTEQLFINNSCNYTPMIIKQMSSTQNVAEFYNNSNHFVFLFNLRTTEGKRGFLSLFLEKPHFKG